MPGRDWTENHIVGLIKREGGYEPPQTRAQARSASRTVTVMQTPSKVDIEAMARLAREANRG